MDNGAKLVDGWSQATRWTSAGRGKGDQPIVLSYDSSPAFTVADGKTSTSALLDTCFPPGGVRRPCWGRGTPTVRRPSCRLLPFHPEVRAALPDSMYVFGRPLRGAAEAVASFAQQPTDPTVDPPRSASTATSGCASGATSPRDDRSAPVVGPVETLTLAALAGAARGARRLLRAAGAQDDLRGLLGRRALRPGRGGRGARSAAGAPRVVWFTVWSSVAGTLLSLLLGVPAAHLLQALVPGRRLLRALLLVPFVLPTVVVGVAFRELIGEAGPLGFLGLDRVGRRDRRGLVFFNVSVVIRAVGAAWRPSTLAAAGRRPRSAQARRTSSARSRCRCRPAIVSAASVVFLFCATAFGVVLTLGGLRCSSVETGDLPAHHEPARPPGRGRPLDRAAAGDRRPAAGDQPAARGPRPDARAVDRPAARVAFATWPATGRASPSRPWWPSSSACRSRALVTGSCGSVTGGLANYRALTTEGPGEACSCRRPTRSSPRCARRSTRPGCRCRSGCWSPSWCPGPGRAPGAQARRALPAAARGLSGDAGLRVSSSRSTSRRRLPRLAPARADRPGPGGAAARRCARWRWSSAASTTASGRRPRRWAPGRCAPSPSTCRRSGSRSWPPLAFAFAVSLGSSARRLPRPRGPPDAADRDLPPHRAPGCDELRHGPRPRPSSSPRPPRSCDCCWSSASGCRPWGALWWLARGGGGPVVLSLGASTWRTTACPPWWGVASVGTATCSRSWGPAGRGSPTLPAGGRRPEPTAAGRIRWDGADLASVPTLCAGSPADVPGRTALRTPRAQRRLRAARRRDPATGHAGA